MQEREELVATLLGPEEYVYNVNRVAVVTTRKLVYIKRKELALTPFERIEIPIGDCQAISYGVHYATSGFIAGALALSLMVLVVWGLFAYGAELESGTQIRVGALVVVAAFGFKRVLGIKRHRLVFKCSGRKYVWVSRPMEFKAKEVSAREVTAFAKTRGLLRSQE